jgi:hypothetical protein
MVGGQQRLDAFGGWRLEAAVAVATTPINVPFRMTDETDVSTHDPHRLHSLPLSPWSTFQIWSSLPLFPSPGDPSPRHLFLTFPFNIPRMCNLRPWLVLPPVVLPPRPLVHLRPRLEEEARLPGLGEGVCVKPPLPSLQPSPACLANPPQAACLANPLQLRSPLPPPRSLPHHRGCKVERSCLPRPRSGRLMLPVGLEAHPGLRLSWRHSWRLAPRARLERPPREEVSSASWRHFIHVLKG